VHRIRIDQEQEAAVLTAQGELDAYAAPDLTSGLEEAGTPGPFVADLSRVSFMDSTALGVLVRALKDAAARGVAARVVLPRSAARRIFEITTLDRVLPVADSPSAALRELRGEPGDRVGEPG
jgi:anti-sigma B factor antagonist